MLRVFRIRAGIKKIILPLFVFATVSLFAQDELSDKEFLTLEDCIQIALQKNVSLRTAMLSSEAAGADVLGSYQGILPSLTASAGKSKIDIGASEFLSNEPVGIDPETGNVIYEQRTRSTEKQSRDNNSANISLSQTIFDGGIWWNQIRKAKADKRSSEYNYLSERNNTILAVKQAYFDLNKQIKLLEAKQMAVQRSQDQVDRTEKMYALGATARLDVYRARVNLGNDRIQLMTQKIQTEESRKKLNLVMGRDPLTPLEIQQIHEVNIKLPDLDELVQTAIHNQPLLKKYEEDIFATDLSISLAKGLNYPRISAYLNYDRFHQDIVKVFSDFDKNYQTRYGINVSINLFNGFKDYVNIQKAEISKRIAQENFEEYKRTLKATLHQYYANYISTLDIIEINKLNLEAAGEEVRLAEERFQIGAGTSLDVREAQVNLTNAEQTLIAAQYNALLLLAQIDAQLGIAYEKMKEQMQEK